MKMKILEKEITEELIEMGFSHDCIFMYGSASRYLESHGTMPEPRDIDMISLPTYMYPPGEYTVYVPSCSLPVNVNVMSFNDIVSEAKSGQMKYFSTSWCYTRSNNYSSYQQWRKLVHENISFESLDWYREITSSASSKAFNKGKKKLTVLEDYDKILGLKNLFHSVCFPIYITQHVLLQSATSNNDYNICDEVMDNHYVKLRTLWEDMNDIYDSTEGDLLAKADAVVKFVKPIYNSTMSDFRKLFPKGNN